MNIESADSIIRISDLVFEYSRDEDEEVVRALDCVNLDVAKGSFTAVIGRNGSGKSTLAKNINALLLPEGGSVVVAGIDTTDAQQLWEIRRNVGMVFQNPDNQLVSAVVEDDVAFGPENLGIEADLIRTRIKESLDSVDMYEHRKMAPHLLSGGQKQRVAIAGVIAMKPEIIIFDEPTAMLDPEGRREVMKIIKSLNKEGITVILITHFMEEAASADRIVIMSRGRIVLDDIPAEIFKNTEKIEELDLRLPFPIQIAARLRERGIAVPENVLTQEDLAKYIVDVAKGEIPGS